MSVHTFGSNPQSLENSDVEIQHLKMAPPVVAASVDMMVFAMQSKGNLQQSIKRTESRPVHGRGTIQVNKSLMVPEGKAAWLTFVVQMVRSKVCLTYLSDRELERVISRSRMSMGRKPVPKNAEADPDLPLCYSWDEAKLAAWCYDEGLFKFRACIKPNHLNGRQLVKVDANALIKMGIRDMEEIKIITSKIRALLGIPRPNMMRALGRRVPFELFLHKKAPTGRTVDLLTFEGFCEKEGFPYDYLIRHQHRTCEIPCACQVLVYPSGDPKVQLTPSDTDASADDDSLANVPTVEFVAREVLIHNKIVQQIIDTMISCVCDGPFAKKKCPNVCKMSAKSKDTTTKLTIEQILEEGFELLGLTEACPKEKLDFSSKVAVTLLEEMYRTSQVLQDITNTQITLKKDVSVEEWEKMKAVVDIFIAEVLPLVSLLSMGGLSLESIFKQEPEFEDFVESLLEEATMELDTTFSSDSDYTGDPNFVPENDFDDENGAMETEGDHNVDYNQESENSYDYQPNEPY